MFAREGHGETSPTAQNLHYETVNPRRERLLQALGVVGAISAFACAMGLSYYLGHDNREPDNHLAVAVGKEFTDTQTLAQAGICEEDLLAAIDHLKRVEAATDPSNPSSSETQAPFIMHRFERHAEAMHGVGCVSSDNLREAVAGYYPIGAMAD